MKIARVFPTKTNMSPGDNDAYFGPPHLWTPQYDEIHISVTFTWDMNKVERLMHSWSKYGKVLLGGPAFVELDGEFVVGRYLKEGVTITSRGCPKNCPWCLVPHGRRPRELDIKPGHIVQDDNLLACTTKHIEQVFEMLRRQTKAIEFKGGIDVDYIEPRHIELLKSIRVGEIWLAYDRPTLTKRDIFRVAVNKLQQYFTRRQLRCYVLIGFKGDTIENAESRLQQAWDIGTLPFAMRYRKPSLNWKNTFVFTDRAWNLLARKWTRPKIIFSRMKNRSPRGV